MAEILWQAEELIAATGGEFQGAEVKATGVSINTRTLQPGQLFIALPGENADGHQYLAQAQQAGAAGAVVTHIPDSAPQDLPLLLVHNTQMTLEDMGRFARKRNRARIIGVTGSVGKTSAKEMLKLALAPYGRVYATAGNYNNHIGLPLTLANMPLEMDYAILEMGMNHAGEIDFLSRLACPHIALITTVEAVHLEFFESVEGIARAKSEIFAGMEEGSPAVLNYDNPYFRLMCEQAAEQELEIISFGENKGADFQVMSAEYTMQGTEVAYHAKGKLRQFYMGSLGRHWPKVALATLAVIDALNLPLEQAEQALAEYTEQPGRGALLTLPWDGGSITLIDDSYNASPVSMKAALEMLGMINNKQGRRVAILGEMRELGPDTPRFHAELAPLIAQVNLTLLCTVGSAMEVMQGIVTIPHQHYSAAEEAGDFLRQIQPGDTILIKGSHGSKVYQLVDAIKAQAKQAGDYAKHAV